MFQNQSFEFQIQKANKVQYKERKWLIPRYIIMMFDDIVIRVLPERKSRSITGLGVRTESRLSVVAMKGIRRKKRKCLQNPERNYLLLRILYQVKLLTKCEARTIYFQSHIFFKGTFTKHPKKQEKDPHPDCLF